jgi:hypothetical protein
MKGDCQWFNSKIEGYFCESLSPEEVEGATEHLRSCLNCRNEVQGLRAMDPLVKQLFEFRMAKANAATITPPRKVMWLRLGFAGATVSLAAVLMFVLLSHETRHAESIASAAPATVERSAPAESPADKASTAADIVRAKPDAPDEKALAKAPSAEIPIPKNAPEFQIMDAAGYSTGLQDYRGRVLLVGVWNYDRPEAAENLQQLYQTFGERLDVRFLGVSRRNQNRLPNTTFPIFFNNGSRLFDANNSEFLIVDKDGKVQMRGELAGDPKVITAKVRAKLDQLGAR